MFLRSLTLKGFKSFADATTLELEPGVTVVVGPNGSGKSNVVDAIAWVLGAQAPSAVRSQKMDDVIFAGTASRPALGRAEVSLTIDNSAGILPLEFSEVTVKRTLFRSGDSEYAINNVPCRLLDVQELLSDARVGRQQHVIVSQGQIDAVLNARPEDRRAIIEEAAGVLKFRKRKEKAERRLDATEANLLRLQDLLREVRRQLRPLERQAEAAQRHGELSAELGGLRVYVAGREIAALRTRLAVLAETRITVGFRGVAAQGRACRSRHRRRRPRGRADCPWRRRRRGSPGPRRPTGRARSGPVGDHRRTSAAPRGRPRPAARRCSRRNTGGRRVPVPHRTRRRAPLDRTGGPDLDELAADEEEFNAERAELLGSLEASPGSTAASAVAEVRGELRTRIAACEQGEAELLALPGASRHSRRARSPNSTRQRSATATIAWPSSCWKVRSSRTSPTPTVGVSGAGRVARAASQRCRDAAEELSNLGARVEALQLALDAAHARAGAEHLAGGDGVLGSLIDFVRIDAGWEAAVEAALGDALAAVVVADIDTAVRALRALRAVRHRRGGHRPRCRRRRSAGHGRDRRAGASPCQRHSS